MDGINLVKGNVYDIFAFDYAGSPNRIFGTIYVRRELFPKSKTEWETFYDVIGGTKIQSSEGLVIRGGILRRIRIPADSIRSLVFGNVISSGELVTKLIQDPDNRTPLVESWLEEVKELGYRS